MAMPESDNNAHIEASPRTERIFFALWPTPGLQSQFHSVAEYVLPLKIVARRARPEKLHLTLAFIGPVSAAVRTSLERHAGAIRVSAFELAFDRIGCFRRRGLLWLGSTQVPPPLLELVEALRAAQSSCELIPETRPYNAHITLARDLHRCPPDQMIAPIVWKVGEFVLVRSNLSANGAKYEIVGRWGLG